MLTFWATFGENLANIFPISGHTAPYGPLSCILQLWSNVTKSKRKCTITYLEPRTPLAAVSNLSREKFYTRVNITFTITITVTRSIEADVSEEATAAATAATASTSVRR